MSKNTFVEPLPISNVESGLAGERAQFLLDTWKENRGVMYLHRAIADEFLEKFVEASSSLTVGDPLRDVDMGPKVSRIERDKVASAVSRSVDAGADVLLKGGILEDGPYSKGHWLAPTVLEVSDNANPVLQEEIFGPVAAAMATISGTRSLRSICLLNSS